VTWRPALKRLDLIARDDTPHLTKGVLILAAHDECVFRSADWTDTLIEVEDGQLEIESDSGGRLLLLPGDVLTLDGLPLRALRSVGNGPTVLVTIRRSAR
jgi:hypothetical protein